MYSLYDIESVQNAFTLCNLNTITNNIDVYYLIDNPNIIHVPDFEENLKNHVKHQNKLFDGSITLRDLSQKEENIHLAQTFGLSDAYIANTKSNQSSYQPKQNGLIHDYQTLEPFVCDTDLEYDEKKHPYLIGYNSYNYDTTMLALYLYETFTLKSKQTEHRSFITQNLISPPSAKQMRDYNDTLFTKAFKDNMPSFLSHVEGSNRPDYQDRRYRIRKNMLLSGRHLDAARLNEKLSKVSLKRLLGMLGYKIKESNKIKGSKSITSADEFYELIAYNVSDIIGLKYLMEHPFYQGQFTLKKGLLSTYPELIYKQKIDKYAPDIGPDNVRSDRLTIDSSSAQFAVKTLCPYGHLKDMPVVSFMYPAEEIAKKYNIPRINVLDESLRFFESHFKQYPEPMKAFREIYDYYKAIEGKNFNTSKHYKEDYLYHDEIKMADHDAFLDETFGYRVNQTNNTKPCDYVEPISLSSIKKPNDCLFYYDKNGTPTSTFVTFSTGGIHGAEYNLPYWNKKNEEYQTLVDEFAYVTSVFPNPIDLKREKKIIMPSGEMKHASAFLTSGSTLKSAQYKDISKNKPILFKEDTLKGGRKLNEEFTFTSADLVNHEDFKSYYPNLLRMMMAFYNTGLGYDRYAEIFENKEHYGTLMKDKTLSSEERALYSVLREGTKLVMNAASGAADAKFENAIIMNNTIISMRIIGQLFSWRIGQAQTIEGAKITSTNTDGLYSHLPDKERNEAILARESKAINVEIEPEEMYLISKDSNNRLELNQKTSEIISASGSTLGCRKGPSPTKSLNHPAILDWALSEYLILCAGNYKNRCNLTKEMDKEIARSILTSANTVFSDTSKFLTMFQTVIASSIGSITYTFALHPDNPFEPIELQHVNRVFFVKENTPDSLLLRSAVARVITDSMKHKREKESEAPIQHDTIALDVLANHGVLLSDIPYGREAAVKKITGLELDWHTIIENESLYELDDMTKNHIIRFIDYEKYLVLMEHMYENWRNKI